MVIRVAMVGANPDYGWGSGVHRRVIQQLPDFTLQGVCTTREDSARRAAEQFGAPLWFTDHRALAAHADIDLVAICVKAPHHHAIAHAALSAGKHVYCEWPLATSVAQAEELATLAERQGVKAMIGLHLHGSPALRQAARLMEEGYVGRLYGVSVHARMFGPIMRAMATRAGGTTLLSIYGGHLIDAIDHVGGGIAECGMRSAIHLPAVDETGAAVERDAFDHLQVHGTLRGGALFNLDLAGVSLSGMGCTWRIEGSEGALQLSTRDATLPAIESLVLHGARHGGPFEPIAIAPEFDCAVIPAEPDRYSAYPGSFASREALSSIGNLYAELGMAIRADTPVTPDFHRAVAIQRMLARLDAPSPLVTGVAA
ncbi:Gfo/Idh/MocA family protein [Sphingobium sp. EM0848]|uniref:Gfo/Idh/MocA family protein n=1 Tax=Sphingobium sp. EM0848 TaxID=2743473 RepID=UPI00159CA860|nr:Gfo/Idh/MocA family oxidoreductase [Sphingobium sp. EM0848]